MIQEIFWGSRENIGTLTIPQEEANESVIVRPYMTKLELSTFAVSELITTPIDYDDPEFQHIGEKVDILFYNRVNTKGEILSSIVYLGDPRFSWDKSDITYIPRNAYYNTSVETAMDLQANKNYSYFNYIRDAGVQDPCFLGTKTEQLPVNGMPSSIVSGNTPIMDGWYTLISAGVLVHPADEFPNVKKGAFVKRRSEFSGLDTEVIEVALKDNPGENDWHPYATYDNSQNIAFYVDPAYGDITMDWYPPFVRQDFFILPRYNKVYESTIEPWVFNKTLYDIFPTMKSRYRVISKHATEKDFFKAQLYLQSVEMILITENWL